jgi:hypothetical protein
VTDEPITYDLDDCPDLSSFADLARPNLFGQDPALLRDDLLGAMREAIEDQPRSRQTEIGPSELGNPCNRWLAHRFAGTEPVGLQKVPWKAAVGTAIHDHFTDWLHRYNEVHGTRFLADVRVWIGDLYPGRPITGKLDGFDLWTCSVIDLKSAGKWAMQHYAPGKPDSPQYEVQIDSYGVGATNAGLTVRNVGLLRVPRDGELHDAVWKVRPHDPQRAATALARAGGIARMVDAIGPTAIPLQPATEHHCGTCPFYSPLTSDLTKSCPGAESFAAKREQRSASLTSLIA